MGKLSAKIVFHLAQKPWRTIHVPPRRREITFGVSLLSPLRPILRNGNPLLKFLGNAFTGERILQRPTPRHLWATDRPRMCYPTCQQLPWCPAHGHASNVAKRSGRLAGYTYVVGGLRVCSSSSDSICDNSALSGLDIPP